MESPRPSLFSFDCFISIIDTFILIIDSNHGVTFCNATTLQRLIGALKYIRLFQFVYVPTLP